MYRWVHSSWLALVAGGAREREVLMTIVRLSCLSVTSALAVLLAGCPTIIECEDDEHYDGTRCVPYDSGMPGDAPGDAGAGDVPCGGCTAPLVCDTATGECEECLGDDASSCGVGGNACVDNTCVACDGNEDCTEVEASLCTAGNECTGCGGDDDCTHLTATPVCDEASNTCVACTIDTEAARCGANSCDPARGMCTTTPRTSVGPCEACVADSECIVAGNRCVPMEFMGTARAGGYCLAPVAGGCTRPFGVPTPARASLSGATAEAYCGISEGVTTCEAVLDLVDDAECTNSDACGVAGLDDGRCETVNGFAGRCTYTCSLSNNCPTGAACPGTDSYCGAP